MEYDDNVDGFAASSAFLGPADGDEEEEGGSFDLMGDKLESPLDAAFKGAARDTGTGDLRSFEVPAVSAPIFGRTAA